MSKKKKHRKPNNHYNNTIYVPSNKDLDEIGNMTFLAQEVRDDIIICHKNTPTIKRTIMQAIKEYKKKFNEAGLDENLIVTSINVDTCDDYNSPDKRKNFIQDILESDHQDSIINLDEIGNIDSVAFINMYMSELADDKYTELHVFSYFILTIGNTVKEISYIVENV